MNRGDSTATGAPSPRVTIVMPAYNAETHLPKVVPAAIEAAGEGGLLVVDPGSSDGTADLAEKLGARVIRLGRRAGPAEARNAGVEEVDADVVLFIDSDCVAHPDVVERTGRAFAENPDLVSLTGSYDADPPEQNYASMYMNLRHHHTHQMAERDNATFWAGCGAVKRSVFTLVGGYDAELYPRPMIEDIELSVRLKPHGDTALDPDLQVTHLKRWTFGSVVKTDIACRAIPWSKLIVTRQGLPDDLNTRKAQRVAALVAPLALLSVVALPLLLWLAPAWAALPAGLILLSALMNFGLVRFFAAKRGLPFAIYGWFVHQLHLFYSAATFTLVALAHRFGKKESA